jgi:hypothetical protein
VDGEVVNATWTNGTRTLSAVRLSETTIGLYDGARSLGIVRSTVERLGQEALAILHPDDATVPGSRAHYAAEQAARAAALRASKRVTTRAVRTGDPSVKS